MEHYIVRIYRRERNNPRFLVGLVEEVGESGKRAFNSIDDLWEILNRQTKNVRKQSGKSAGRHEGVRRK